MILLIIFISLIIGLIMGVKYLNSPLVYACGVLLFIILVVFLSFYFYTMEIVEQAKRSKFVYGEVSKYFIYEVEKLKRMNKEVFLGDFIPDYIEEFKYE